jgi:hypothetical protein
MQLTNEAAEALRRRYMVTFADAVDAQRTALIRILERADAVLGDDNADPQTALKHIQTLAKEALS